MKILLLSDSHGNLNNVFTAMDFFENEINIIFHLGDFFNDTFEIKKKYPNIKVIAVNGNNDFSEENLETLVTVEDKKIFLTHGHNYNVYFGVDKLFYKAKEIGADICVFGHTHNPSINTNENVLILNPGSISYPRKLSVPTFGILEIENSNISYKFFGVEENKIREINFL